MLKTCLVTGGLGFIGSHVVVELLSRNYEVIIIDNLSNSSLDVLNNIKKITNKRIIFYRFDLKDKLRLNMVFNSYKIDFVMHFAGLKAVNESIKMPLQYYDNNITS